MAGAFVATAVALILYAVHAPVKPSLVVAAGIIMLLAGIALTGAVQDAITGYYVTAAARSLEAMLLTGGIIAGVSLGITLGIKLGLPVAIEAQTIQLANLPIMVGSGALMAVAFAYASYAPLRSLLPVAVVGAAGSLVFTLMTRAEFGPAWSTAAAAFAVGLGGYSLGRRSGVPPLVVVVSGTVPLLPGLTIYKGLYEVMTLGNLIGIVSLATAVAIGVALASGVILGEYVAQPIRREARRLEDRLAGPRLVRPPPPIRRRTSRPRRRTRTPALGPAGSPDFLEDHVVELEPDVLAVAEEAGVELDQGLAAGVEVDGDLRVLRMRAARAFRQGLAAERPDSEHRLGVVVRGPDPGGQAVPVIGAHGNVLLQLVRPDRVPQERVVRAGVAEVGLVDAAAAVQLPGRRTATAPACSSKPGSVTRLVFRPSSVSLVCIRNTLYGSHCDIVK